MLESTVFNTALLLEGGSMRGTYTAGAMKCLLENWVFFDNVYGVSAGSSNAVNYVSRDANRVVEAFGGLMAEPVAGNWKTFIQGKGMFNAHYLYQEAGKPGAECPFDFDTFCENPAKVTLFSFDSATGEDLYFTKDDFKTLDDLMIRVRASSTLPFFMPAPTVDGRVCYDGGFAEGGGLPMKKVLEDGFERMVVIRTRKRGYRKPKPSSFMKMLFPTKPLMHEAVVTRNQRYNEACDYLDELEKQGLAYVFYAEDLTMSGSERDAKLFYENIDAGYNQMQRDLLSILEFVGRGE